jgi:hypothetical protein
MIWRISSAGLTFVLFGAASTSAIAQGRACPTGYEWNEYSKQCTWKSSSHPSDSSTPVSNRLERECSAGYKWSDADRECVSANRQSPLYEKKPSNETVPSKPY